MKFIYILIFLIGITGCEETDEVAGGGLRDLKICADMNCGTDDGVSCGSCSEEQICSLDNICIDSMVSIPAGTFTMGCNEQIDSECYADEKTPHEVTLSAFKIDIYEVTVADFKACVKGGRCSSSSFELDRNGNFNYENSDRDDHPMNGVDWNGANAYCQWLGKRLPTEAEWEYAARGADNPLYPWGNEEPSSDYAVYDVTHTAVVGSKPLGASPFGLYDMAGNVWEWCSDWYGDYSSSPVTNPKGATSGSERVLRGGSWITESSSLRVSYRYNLPPTQKENSIGFRCAQSE